MPQTLAPEPTRHLPLEGTYNVRDLGGYPTRDGRVTRWRTFFRADCLHRLPSEAQASLLSHGVRTVIDLRRTDELQAAPNVFANADTVTYLHLSLMTDSQPAPGELRSLVDLYRRILDERQAKVCEALRLLAAPQTLPSVIHCTAGKDRTGLIVALALGLAGVPEETIIEDYALSSTYLGEAYVEETRQRVTEKGHIWEQYKSLVGCPPDYMRATIQYLNERYGGMAAYANTIGFGRTQVQRLQTALLV